MAIMTLTKAVVVILLSFLVAQLIKIISNYMATKKFDLGIFWHTGGMPSSHTASVIALSSSIYLMEGFSNLFLVSILFSLVVMVDAIGVRRAVGENSKLLNKIAKDLNRVSLKEKGVGLVLGHTPAQVLAGAILGLVITLAVFYI